MLILQAIVLGVVQGVTEFLPVSSSGHLVLLPELLGWELQDQEFDVILHLGTTLALIVFFYADLMNILRSLYADFKSKNSFRNFDKNSKLGVYMVLAGFPAAFFGLLFEQTIEQNFRSLLYVTVFLLLGTVLMYLAEKRAHKAVAQSKDLNVGDSLIIGCFQALALMPGVSRSGATISGGMLLGFSRHESARFSFLLSIPIIVGAALLKAVNIDGDMNLFAPTVVTGFISSFFVGLISIKFLLGLLRTKTLKPFIYYRILLIAVLLVFILLGV